MRPKLSKFEYGKPMFRVINKIKARPGQFFLTRAVEKGLPYLGQDVSFYLKRLGKVN